MWPRRSRPAPEALEVYGITGRQLEAYLAGLSDGTKDLPVYFVGERLVKHAGVGFASGRDGAPTGIVLSDY